MLAIEMIVVLLFCLLPNMAAYAEDSDSYVCTPIIQNNYPQSAGPAIQQDAEDAGKNISIFPFEIGDNLLEHGNSNFSKSAIRYVPIRWIELHPSRYPECQNPDGSVFRHPIPASDPSAWRSSEYMHWMISRMNDIYSGTGIQFWLQSHEIYATGTITDFLIDKNTGKGKIGQLTKKYSYYDVLPDISMIFPHSDLSQMGIFDSLRRERWLQKAVALFDDAHGMTVFVHSDYQNGITPPFLPYPGNGGNDFVLPQHGYFPWDSPGMAFLFLSSYTWESSWQFAPELTPAHELGHALGNLHTLDFEKGGWNTPAFPDGSKLGWADFWDLSYVIDSGKILAFDSRRSSEQWISSHGSDKVHRIDDLWNIALDKSNGGMSAELDYDPAHIIQSGTTVPDAIRSSPVRLLQGLSFDLPYTSCCKNPAHQYSWQRNIMSYRYPDKFYTKAEALNPSFYKSGSVDPYDHMTARFSQSQIELMQKQLQGSTRFTEGALADYGTIAAGKASYFASRFDLLGDGRTEDFVWYSNGEGVKDVNLTDRMKDMIAFRASPAGSFGIDSKAGLVSGDFNGDKLTDLLWYDNKGLMQIWWSRVDPRDKVHRWNKEILSGADKGLAEPIVCTGDFDGNGADDIFMIKRGENKARVVYFKKDPGDRKYASCLLYVKNMIVGQISSPLAVGNFDGCNGDDIVWASYPYGTTQANFLWSDNHGDLVQDLGHKVGDAKYEPHSGNFNGIGSCDLLWYNPTNIPEILWRDSYGQSGRGCQKMQAIDDPKNGVDRSLNIIGSWSDSAGNSIWPRLTIGDFDGNGADDIMVLESHEPKIYFSKYGYHSKYEGSYDLLYTALHNSGDYMTAAGEFDGATDAEGKLGDDIYLYYSPTAPISNSPQKCPPGRKCCEKDELGNCLLCVGPSVPCNIDVKCPAGSYCQLFDDYGNCMRCGQQKPQ